MDNIYIKSFLDSLHMLATIAWFGSLFVNFALLKDTVQKTLTPETSTAFMKLFMKKSRIIVYISFAILFITGIPLKIVSPYYVSIINFSNTWQITMFIKHVFVAILGLLVIINFEIITPRFQKLAANGPSADLKKIEKVRQMIGLFSVSIAFIIIILSAIMNHL